MKQFYPAEIMNQNNLISRILPLIQTKYYICLSLHVLFSVVNRWFSALIYSSTNSVFTAFSGDFFNKYVWVLYISSLISLYFLKGLFWLYSYKISCCWIFDSTAWFFMWYFTVDPGKLKLVSCSRKKKSEPNKFIAYLDISFSCLFSAAYFLQLTDLSWMFYKIIFYL